MKNKPQNFSAEKRKTFISLSLFYLPGQIFPSEMGNHSVSVANWPDIRLFDGPSPLAWAGPRNFCCQRKSSDGGPYLINSVV